MEAAGCTTSNTLQPTNLWHGCQLSRAHISGSAGPALVTCSCCSGGACCGCCACCACCACLGAAPGLDGASHERAQALCGLFAKEIKSAGSRAASGSGQLACRTGQHVGL